MIQYGRQSIHEDDIQSVVTTLESDFLTTGPQVAAFEKKISQLMDIPFTIAVNNATFALHIAVLALSEEKGFKGITTPITFAASANCILYNGGELNLIDVSPNKPHLDLNLLEDYLKKNSVDIVVPVSFAGLAFDLPKLSRLSEKYGFKIIEDASHAFGTTYTINNQKFYSGSCHHSDIGVYSFHPIKNITTAEGGLICTRDERIYKKLLALRNHGIYKEQNPNPHFYNIKHLGFNGRLSDIHAALGITQLSKLFDYKERRTLIAKKYQEAFSSLENISCIQWDNNKESPFFHIYPIQIDSFQTKIALINFLTEKGIGTQTHYVPIHYHDHFKGHLKNLNLPNSESYYETCLTLPIFPLLKEEEQSFIIDSVFEFFKSTRLNI